MEEGFEENFEESSDGTGDELPPWLKRTLASVESLPGLATKLPYWLPTLIAAWRAGSAGLALSSTLRERLSEDEPLTWPDELAAEFITTLSEVFDVLPSVDEALPLAAGVLDLGTKAVDDLRARALVLESMNAMEALGQHLAGRLLEMAFFAPPDIDPANRARHLRRLFLHLESLFDRVLQIWLVEGRSRGTQA